MSANDAAFPYVIRSNSDAIEVGLTKREYFAAMAMQGYLSATGLVASNLPTDEDVARYSFQMADAMIKEGEK